MAFRHLLFIQLCFSYHSLLPFPPLLGFPCSSMVKKKKICLQCTRWGFNPWVRKIPWGRKLQPSLVFLSGKSHGQRTLVGYSSWGCRRVKHDLTTEHQHDPFPVHSLFTNTFIVYQHKELVDLVLVSLWIKASFQVSVRRRPNSLELIP